MPRSPQRLRLGSLSFALFFCACGGVAPSAPSSALGSSPPSASTGSAKPGDVAAPPSADVAPTSAVASAPPAPTPSPFVAVAELPYEMSLYALDDRLIGVGAAFVADDGQPSGMPMGLLDGDRFLPKPAMTFPSIWGGVVDVRGSWPGGVDLVAIGTTGRIGIAQHWVLTDDGKWVHRRSREGSLPAGIAEVDGARLTLEFPAMMPGMHRPEWRSLRGPKLVRSQAPVPPACRAKLASDGNPSAFSPTTQVVPDALGATRAGALLVVGEGACDGGPMLETWAPKTTTSTIVPLSGLGEKPWDVDTRIVTGRGENEAWILRGQVARFGNGSTQVLPPLPKGVAFAAAPAAEGSLYVIASEFVRGDANPHSRHLFRYDASSAAWAEVETGVANLDSIVTDAQGTVWISAGKTLLRTRRNDAEASIAIAAPRADGAKGRRRARALPKPASPLCPTNLVVLYGFTKVTPPDYDFPLTRKAIKGHTELAGTRFVVAEDGGQKFFTAIVPDVAIGRKLVALIEREVQGSKPQLLCADPVVVRELRIDLRTGDIAP